jgi:hypothetical protein
MAQDGRSEVGEGGTPRQKPSTGLPVAAARPETLNPERRGDGPTGESEWPPQPREMGFSP